MPTAGYEAFCAHYCTEAVFCSHAGGQEKGLGKKAVGTLRRAVFCPRPHVRDFTKLNERLRHWCEAYESHTIRGREHSVGDMHRLELTHLLALPRHPLDTAERLVTRAGPRSAVTSEGCRYCVPVGSGGREVTVIADPWQVRVLLDTQELAVHRRLYVRAAEAWISVITAGSWSSSRTRWLTRQWSGTAAALRQAMAPGRPASCVLQSSARCSWFHAPRLSSAVPHRAA